MFSVQLDVPKPVLHNRGSKHRAFFYSLFLFVLPPFLLRCACLHRFREKGTADCFSCQPEVSVFAYKRGVSLSTVVLVFPRIRNRTPNFPARWLRGCLRVLWFSLLLERDKPHLGAKKSSFLPKEDRGECQYRLRGRQHRTFAVPVLK